MLAVNAKVETYDLSPSSLSPIEGKPATYEVKLALPTCKREQLRSRGKVIPLKFQIELKKAIQ